MKRLKEISILRSGIPLSRGNVEHIETGDSDRAQTQYQDGIVERVFTPNEPIKRLHETLHARFSNPSEVWPHVHSITKGYIEDAKIHTQHWPWGLARTPKLIQKSIGKILRDEFKTITKAQNTPGFVEDSYLKAERLGSILRALSLPNGRALLNDYAASSNPKIVSCEELVVLEAVRAYCSHPEKWHEGALLFDKLAGLSPENPMEGEGKGAPVPIGGIVEKMDIEELPRFTPTLTAPIIETSLASSGRTLNWRELLRGKFAVPNRMFIREAELDNVGGTILIDGSGSMKVTTETLSKMCAVLPAATIAYYIGRGNGQGTLYIYARNGKRANITPLPYICNSVDGPAQEWLLRQDGPRYFVTDVGFCGAGMLSMIAIAKFREHKKQKLFQHFITLEETVRHFQTMRQ